MEQSQDKPSTGYFITIGIRNNDVTEFFICDAVVTDWNYTFKTVYSGNKEFKGVEFTYFTENDYGERRGCPASCCNDQIDQLIEIKSYKSTDYKAKYNGFFTSKEKANAAIDTFKTREIARLMKIIYSIDHIKV